MQKLLSDKHQLLSPNGKPVNSDRVMALNKWAQHLSRTSAREIVLAGMGRPTYPVNEKLTNAELGYWGSIAEKARVSRSIIKTFERTVKAKEDELKDSNEQLEELSTSPSRSQDSPVKKKPPSKLSAWFKRNFQLPLDIHLRARTAGYAAVDYSEPGGDKESRTMMAEGLSRFYGLEKRNIIQAEDVLFTVGGSTALHITFQAINKNRPHGRIVTTNPYYSLHAGADHANRLHTIDVMKLPGYRLTAEALKKEIARAKENALVDDGKISAFVFCYPNNPTGQVLNRKEWEDIANVFREDKTLDDTIIILDEAYAELQLDGNEHVSLYQVAPELHSRIVLIRCGTKGLSGAGERLGAVVCKNHDLLEELEDAQTKITGVASKSGCHAYAAAMDELGEGEQQRLVAWYAPLVSYVADGLKTIGADMPDKEYKVNGTFYVMADLSEFIGTPMIKEAQKALPGVTTISTDEQLAYHLLFKDQLMISPMSYFGVNPKSGFVRITCSDGQHIQDLIERLTTALTELRETKCAQFSSQVESRLHRLNQLKPTLAAEIVGDFNAKELGAFKITQQAVKFIPTNLNAFGLKELSNNLHRLYLDVGAEIKSMSPNDRADAANKLKKLFRHNVEQNKRQRLSLAADKMWSVWVDNFVDKEDRLANKKLPPALRLKKYPNWGFFSSALRQEYFEHGYAAKEKSAVFDVKGFTKKMAGRVKQMDAKHQGDLKASISQWLSSPRSREDTDDAYSSDTVTPTDSMSASPEGLDSAKAMAHYVAARKKNSAECDAASGLAIDEPRRTEIKIN